MKRGRFSKNLKLHIYRDEVHDFPIIFSKRCPQDDGHFFFGTSPLRTLSTTPGIAFNGVLATSF